MSIQEQIAAVKQVFSGLDSRVKVRWDRTFDCPATIRGRLSPASTDDPKKIAGTFLTEHQEILRIGEPDKALWVDRVKTDSAGNSRVHFHQFYEDLPVWGGYAAVHTNSSGQVTGYESKYHQDLAAKLSPDVLKTLGSNTGKKKDGSAKKAVEIAKEHSGGDQQGDPFLLIYPHKGAYHIAYHVEVGGDDNGHPADWVYFIDAKTGQILHRTNTIDFAAMVDGRGIGINLDETAASPERRFRVYHDDDGNYYLRNTDYTPEFGVYDMAGGGQHNGFSGRNDRSMDADSDWDDYTAADRSDNQRPETEGFWALQRIVDYYTRDKLVNGIHLFDRNGWDDLGGDWRMVVHYRQAAGSDYSGSFFSRNATHGSRVYHGDGDGTHFTYKAVLDASAHEWVHGLQFSEIAAVVPGAYAGFDGNLAEPFAIKEATADVLACCLDTLGGGWHMGTDFEEGIVYYSGSYPEAISLRLRSIEDPSKYNDTSDPGFLVEFSDHMDAAADSSGRGFTTTGDGDSFNGYLNSTILSHAFYLMAMGGSHPVGVPGYEAIDVVGQGIGFVENIVYRYHVQHAAAQDSLQDFRDKIIQSCVDLYPGNTCKHWCVKRAFDAVGLYDDTLGGVEALPAGVNLSITPWGAKNGRAPYWQSPDVYCLDSSDAIVDPLKNQVNRLVAVLRNNGSTAASNATVNFFFAPFGMGYRHEDFKMIGSQLVDVPADGTDVMAEVSWDLTDLSDDFGGVWPFPVGDFDHFCVRVHITHPGEIYDCDNECQHNFTNVDTVPDDDGDGIWKFLIANPHDRPAWAVIHARSMLPATMPYKLHVFGDDTIDPQTLPDKPAAIPKGATLVALGARQKRIAVLSVAIPRDAALRLAKASTDAERLTSLSMTAVIEGEEVGGIEVGFFAKGIWNRPSKRPMQPVLTPPCEIEGKVYSLSYSERGEFVGFTLRFLDGGRRYFPSLSERLEERLNEARFEDRFVALRCDEHGAVLAVSIDGR